MNDFQISNTESKIWIYQSSKDLSLIEQDLIKEQMAFFISHWQSHGNELKAYFHVFKNRFICIEVDENINKATGCSIDKCVNFMIALGNKMNIDFLNRDLLYENDDKIYASKISEIKSKISNQLISADTYIYNVNILTKSDFVHNFRLKAKDSWLKRYFIN